MTGKGWMKFFGRNSTSDFDLHMISFFDACLTHFDSIATSIRFSLKHNLYHNLHSLFLIVVFFCDIVTLK
jgi:hypothetical protein